MCSSRWRLALAAAVLFNGCSRDGERGLRTVALPPFENLAPADLDWMSRGFSECLRLQLSGTVRTRPVTVAALREVPATGAVRVVHGYFSVAGGRLTVRADIEDTATHRMERNIAASGPLSAGMLPIARDLARAMDASARELPTRSAEAIHAYSAALQAGGADSDRGFEKAVSADPNFGAAYLAWAQALVSRGDRARAAEVAAAARAHAGAFPELERIRLAVLSAALAGDRAAQRQALATLARTDAGDPAIYRALGELDTSAHSYASAARWYEEVLKLRPDDATSLNMCGYAYAWAGEFDRAVKTMERYRTVRPGEANPIDSLADVYYYFGRFSDAARLYEEAHTKDPSFLSGGELYKAAWARLMLGDRKAADDAFARFLAARQAAQDTIIPYRQAQWEYVTGRGGQALARMEEFARSAPAPAASIAWAQLGFWSLEAGDRNRALAFVQKATAPGPLPLLCTFLAQPPAPAAEWATRAERLMPQPQQAGLRRLALGYALLLSKDFAGAAAPLEQVWEGSLPSSPDWPGAPLAWALIESGRFDRVPELLNPNPAPEAQAERPFLSLSFPRLFYLRGALAEKQNRRDDARANYRRFLELAGDLPDYFGQREHAAKALARL